MALDLEKLAAPNPLLHGDGLIFVPQAASAIGLPKENLLTELQQERAALYTQARNWQGWCVADIDTIERDFDGTFILNDVEQQGVPQTLSGVVRAFDPATTIAALATDGAATESVFLQSGKNGFWPLEMVRVPLSAWMVQKGVVERIRTRLAAHISTPPQTPAKTSPSPVPAVLSRQVIPSVAVPTPTAGVHVSVDGHPFIIADAITAKYGHWPFSKLYSTYKNHRTWSQDQARRMDTEADLFIELMGDPILSSIGVEMIPEYARRLSKLPSDIYQSRRRYKVSTLNELTDIAEQNSLVRKNETTVKGHVGRIAEILNYAVRKGMMHANPASGFKREWGVVTQKARAQDDRDTFTDEELDQIFSQSWFAQGAGTFSKNGKTNWRPHYFWLPLLALTSGGRLNELAQLYLDDIKRDEEEGGAWYLDFNLNQPDKIDADAETDKSLKTINSIRIVPLHEIVIRAGLPEYVAALREAGYTRLFPELKRDPVKGYGKPAGSWFNERFLGEQLGIERNGKKTFHSLRHCFCTALERLDTIPERVITQLSGHARGQTQAGTRYIKDRQARELQPIIDRLVFPCLADVGNFDIDAGLRAITIAERRKKALARSRKNT